MLPGETLWPNVCVGAIDLDQQSNSVRLNPLPFAPSLCQYHIRPTREVDKVFEADYLLTCQLQQVAV